MFRLLFRLLVLGFIIYAIFYWISPETRHRGLAAVGLDHFFEETVPVFLHEKLSIPKNPAAERARMLRELSEKIVVVEKELEAVVPAGDGGSAAGPLPPAAEIRASIEKSRDALVESEALLAGIEEINASDGVVRKATSRLLDVVLPLEESGSAGADADCVCTQP